MTIWVDAQLPPSIAAWVTANYEVTALALRDIGLRDAEDQTIFTAARDAGAIVITKDADFVMLQQRLGSPPDILWLTCGSTSNARLREMLAATLADALELLNGGEHLVELRDATIPGAKR